MKVKTRKAGFLGLSILLIITLAIYIPSLSFGWLNWDDASYVLNNPLIHQLSLSNFIKNITTIEIVGTYQPLTNVSFMIDYAIWGKNATGFHLTNLLLHLCNGLLVFLIVNKLKLEKLAALIVMGVFLLHPMHVESVLWISERKDVLYSLFFLLGIYYYLKDPERKTPIIVFFFCALLSKVMAITFPLILIILDYYKKDTVNKGYFINKAPYFLISIVFAILGYIAQKDSGAVELSLNFYERTLLVFQNLGIYIIKFFYPQDLSILHPLVKVQSLPLYTLVVGLVAVTAGIYGVFRTKMVSWAFGLLFFIICLLPVLQFIPFGSAQYAERYTYLAYIGLSIAAISVLKGCIERMSLSFGVGLPILGGIFLLYLMLGSSIRIKEWESNYTLWEGVINHYPDNQFAYVKLAQLYANNGDPSTALKTLSSCLEVVDNKFEVYAERARLFEKQGLFEEALEDYAAAILDNPSSKVVILNKAKLLAQHFNQKEEAALLLEALIQDHPGYEQTYINLGVIKEQTGKLDEALNVYSQGILNTKKRHRLYRYRAVVHWKLKAIEKAFVDLNQSISIKKDYGEAYWIRSNFYLDQGKREAALKDMLSAQSHHYLVPLNYIQDLEK